MNIVFPLPRQRVAVLATIACLLAMTTACRSDANITAGKEPWARQSRREIERDWWIQNRYDDSRPSALNPGGGR